MISFRLDVQAKIRVNRKDKSKKTNSLASKVTRISRHCIFNQALTRVKNLQSNVSKSTRNLIFHIHRAMYCVFIKMDNTLK